MKFNDDCFSRNIINYKPGSPNFTPGKRVSDGLKKLVASKRLELIPHSVKEDEQRMSGSARFREPQTGVYLEYEFFVDIEIVDAVTPRVSGDSIIHTRSTALRDELGQFYKGIFAQG
jgi:hypothetical protein